MDIEAYRAYCLQKKGVTEEFPFGETTLVYKVMGKMFALTDLPDYTSINLKVEPEHSVELRERYPAVHPGYHMNKKHWITVLMDGTIPDKLLCSWIDTSYNLVANSLTKKQRASLDKM